MQSLLEQFGNIDIYLFDQLLKGRFDGYQRVLDAGCGGGRNLHYFLQNGYEVYGIDESAEAIARVQALAKRLQTEASPYNFVQANLTQTPFNTGFFDLVLANAVLHFANNTAHFEAMLFELWRLLRPKGFLFIRLASDIGIEDKVQPLSAQRFLLPDGTTRFLVNMPMLLHYTEKLGAVLLEPIKTTNVQGLRCMTTWCLGKE